MTSGGPVAQPGRAADPFGAGAPVQHYGSADLVRDDIKNPLGETRRSGVQIPPGPPHPKRGERAPNLFYHIPKVYPTGA